MQSISAEVAHRFMSGFEISHSIQSEGSCQDGGGGRGDGGDNVGVGDMPSWSLGSGSCCKTNKDRASLA